MTNKILPYSYILAFFLTAFLSKSSLAQEIVGLWEVKEVSLDGQPSPVNGKWTKINEDGTFQTGNGWLQTAEGRWTFDEESEEFTHEEKLGIKDPHGPFLVSFQQDKMIWERDEDGSQILVIMEKTPALPKSIADRLNGLWTLESYRKNGEEIETAHLEESLNFLLFRWDKVYIQRKPSGENLQGIWYINGSKPELILLDPHQLKNPEIWQVSVTNEELILVGQSSSNRGTEAHYVRIDEIPQAEN